MRIGIRSDKKLYKVLKLAELNSDKEKPPKMVAIRSDHYSNLVGSVDLITYFEGKHYKVEWNFKEKFKEQSKYDGKIREIWRYDPINKEKETFSNLKLAVSKFTEIFRILRDKAEQIEQKRCEERLREDEEQKVSRIIELKDMNLRVLNAIRDYIESILCLNCRRPNVRYKIDEDTGEFYGICLTCNYKNTLPNLLLKEKELRTAMEARIRLKEAGMKKCPFCGEIIEIDTIKCNKCSSELKSDLEK